MKQGLDNNEEEGEDIWGDNDNTLGAKVVDDSEVVIGKRLALANMDWDNMSAVDILALFRSFCKGEMYVT